MKYKIYKADDDSYKPDQQNLLLEGESNNLQTLIKYKLEKYTHEINK